MLTNWVYTGSYSHRSSRQASITHSKPKTPPPLLKAINDITQNNPKILLQCFSHIRPDQRVMMAPDEFQQALLIGGLGQGCGHASIHRAKQNVKQLFQALQTSPDSGYADINRLLKFVENDTTVLCNDRNVQRLDEPKKVKDMGSSLSNAENRLRLSLQHGFKTLKSALERNQRLASVLNRENHVLFSCTWFSPFSFLHSSTLGSFFLLFPTLPHSITIHPIIHIEIALRNLKYKVYHLDGFDPKIYTKLLTITARPSLMPSIECS